MAKKNDISPRWYQQPYPEGSWRSLFKWGDRSAFKHPGRGFVRLLCEALDLDAEHFRQPHRMGLEAFEAAAPSGMEPRHRAALAEIVGAENVRSDAYTRTRVSFGGGMLDALRLRRQIVENLPDLALYPRHREDVEEIVAYCRRERIPVYVRGGGSSVTRGSEAVCGGVTLDLSVHMKRVIAFNEENQTITVEPGMSGPELEEALRQAPERFQARRRYTCGHFPQSFEYSSVGGWVVTRGAGQNSTYYGKIEDLVIAQEYVTPAGVIRTPEHPRAATGPDIDQALIGSEGCFGVLTAVTLRVFRRMPENTRRCSYLFRDWESARAACREIMQAEQGFPSVFRLSDPEETDAALRMYGVQDTPADGLLRLLGYRPMQRCLLIASADGGRGFTRLVERNVRRVCSGQGALNLSPFGVTRRWERDRFRDPYMREDLQDFGILTDTLECAVNWAQMDAVYRQVREHVKRRPNTICMTHLSHAYPQGANLYFIFIARMDGIREYLELQYGILEAIQKSGASMSHHHGIGKQTGPWLEGQIGTPAMGVIRALKAHFDPQNIMNPGGTLGLDLSEEQREKTWGMELDPASELPPGEIPPGG